ncbi:MAG: ATP-binding protein [Sciscionella sp.]
MSYVPRLVDTRLTELLTTFPAVLVLGPRAVGKTTTARRLAATVVELDDPAQAAQFHADPTAALDATLRRTDGPLLLDEWQEVPEVLAAIKRAVDRGAQPGSFVLTGSVRALLTSASWPGTGRIITIDMHPMTVLEQYACAPPQTEFVSRLMAGDLATIALPTTMPDLAGYVDLAILGGFPPVLGILGVARTVWLDSYVEQLVLRDVPELGEIRDPAALRRLLYALTESSGRLTADTALAAATDMNVKTVRRQERLLQDLRIISSLPAWHTNRLSRLIKQRKRYAIDTGLATTLLGTDSAAVLANGDLLGRILETFVIAQLIPLLGMTARRIRTYHLRQHDGRHEIDVLLEGPNGRIAGIEIKASASPARADARHLMWLRDELPELFTAGIVLHTGKVSYSLDRDIMAIPIAALWG